MFKRIKANKTLQKCTFVVKLKNHIQNAKLYKCFLNVFNIYSI